MAEKQTLKDQLFALCDENDLNYVSIAVYTLPSGERFLGCSVHGTNEVGSDNARAATAAEGLANAIADLNGKRFGKPVIAELEAA